MNNYPDLPWTPSSLRGKTVTFEMMIQGVPIAGNGKLSVLTDDIGILSVRINAVTFTKSPLVRWQSLGLTAAEAMHLKKSNSADFDFELFTT
jgi:hypothetical protein